jgi:restriction system protein
MTGSSDPAILPAPPPSPTYPEISHTVRLLDGEPARRVRDMMTAIFHQSARPQRPLDWADPGSWIEAPLPGELGTLARKLWEGSGKTLNPRHLYIYHRFAVRLKLLEKVAGTYRVSERGRLFLAGDKAILRELVDLRSAKRRPDGATELESEAEAESQPAASVRTMIGEMRKF